MAQQKISQSNIHGEIMQYSETTTYKKKAKTKLTSTVEQIHTYILSQDGPLQKSHEDGQILQLHRNFMGLILHTVHTVG